MRGAAIAVVSLIACRPPPTVETTRYRDGRTSEEITMRNGVRHGPARTWHPNGKLASQGNYVLGKREGRFYFYTPDAKLEYQALFIRDEEVWRSTDPAATPDRAAISSERTKRIDEEHVATKAMLPIPWFATIDRTTELDRVGAQIGFGGPAALSFGSVRRLEVFGNYATDRIGAYGQYSQTSLETMSGVDFSGKRSLELGATLHLPLVPVGTTTARLGIAVPLGSDDGQGFVASTAGSFQRPADASASIPSAVVARASASWTHVIKRFVFQGDVGADALLGGEPRAFDTLARMNLGLGFGARSRMLTLEVSNTVPVLDVDRWLLGVSLGGGWRISGVWASLALTHTVFGDTTLTTAVGYEL